MNIQGLSHITIGVLDLNKSRDFYSSLFSTEPISKEDGKDCHFVIGSMWFVLVQDPQVKPASGYTHIALTVSEEDFESTAESIRKSNARIWQENKTFGKSLYFEDPDGHKLEIHSSTWQDRFNITNGSPQKNEPRS